MDHNNNKFRKSHIRKRNSLSDKYCKQLSFGAHPVSSSPFEPSELPKLALVKKHMDHIRVAADITNNEITFLKHCENVRSQISQLRQQMHCEIDKAAEEYLRRINMMEEEYKKISDNKKRQWFATTSDLQSQSLSWIASEGLAASMEVPSISFFPPKEISFGELRTSASAAKSTVTVADEAVANRFNVCTVNLRNFLNEPVVECSWEMKVSVVEESGDYVYTVAKNMKNGQVEIRFYPLRSGQVTLHIVINSHQVQGTPKVINVIEEDEEILVPAIVFGEAGEQDGQFSRPWGVCCDRRGRILVADRCNHRIQIFSEDGTFQTKFGRMGFAPGEFNRPAGICVDKHDRIIVADKDNHRIQIFDSDGVYIYHFGKSELEEESLNYPWDIAVNENCQIAVTEAKRPWVRLFSDSGILLKKCDFSHEKGLPRGIACLPNGSYLVTDLNNHKLTLLDKDLLNPLCMGSQGPRPGQFQRPQSITVNGVNMYAVSDCKNYRIQIFKDGVIHAVFGRKGTDWGHFDAPQGIAFHPNGSLIVVDFGNSRIQIFNI